MPVCTLPDELKAHIEIADSQINAAKSLATERERVMLGWAS